MTHAASHAVGLAALGSKLGGLIQDLVALRTEIDATFTAVASHDASLPVAAVGKTARSTSAASPGNDSTVISPIHGAAACPLNELGVIGYVLGLRPDMDLARYETIEH